MENTKLKERLMSANGTTTALAATVETNTSFVALESNALDIIRENLKNQPLSMSLFDIVKSPSGGSTVFSVPGISGEEAEKSLTGIILDYSTPRAYWETPDPVEGTLPTCFSDNSIVSHDGKACTTCPFNDYGSRDGDSNAKACKESVVLYLLRENSIMPLVVRIPASSKRIFQRYLTRLVGRMIPISSVVTRITLEKKTNKNGQPYAAFNFEAVGELAADEAASAREFGKQFAEMMKNGDAQSA